MRNNTNHPGCQDGLQDVLNTGIRSVKRGANFTQLALKRAIRLFFEFPSERRVILEQNLSVCGCCQLLRLCGRGYTNAGKLLSRLAGVYSANPEKEHIFNRLFEACGAAEQQILWTFESMLFVSSIRILGPTCVELTVSQCELGKEFGRIPPKDTGSIGTEVNAKGRWSCPCHVLRYHFRGDGSTMMTLLRPKPRQRLIGVSLYW